MGKPLPEREPRVSKLVRNGYLKEVESAMRIGSNDLELRLKELLPPEGVLNYLT